MLSKKNVAHNYRIKRDIPPGPWKYCSTRRKLIMRPVSIGADDIYNYAGIRFILLAIIYIIFDIIPTPGTQALIRITQENSDRVHLIVTAPNSYPTNLTRNLKSAKTLLGFLNFQQYPHEHTALYHYIFVQEYEIWFLVHILVSRKWQWYNIFVVW